MRARKTAARRAEESGQVAIELVGYAVLLMLVTLLAVQGIVAAQAASAAQEAARNGARAMSLGQDWREVVDDTLPDWARADVVDGARQGDTAKVRVSVRVPIGLRSITSADLRFDRSAELPIQEDLPWP